MTNEVKIQSYSLKSENEIIKQFTFDDIEVYLTFDSKTNEFKETDIEIEQYEETFCKTLNKEVSLKLLKFLKENLGDYLND